MEIRVKFDAALWFVCALCAAIAISALLMAYPALWPWLGKNSSNIASWFQAFGSIVAILAGFKVARFSIEESERRQAIRDGEILRQKFRKSCLVIFDVCSQVYGWADPFYRNMDKAAGKQQYFVIGCDNVLSRISNLTPEDFPDPVYIMDLTRLRVQLDIVRYMIAVDDVFYGESLDGFKASIKNLIDESQRLQNELYRNAESNSTAAEIEMMNAYNRNRFGEHHS